MPSPGAESVVHLQDEASVEDLRTFLTRAGTVDREGAVRLQATDTVFVVSVGVLDSPLVVGMRTAALADPGLVDAVVPLAAVLDRLARRDAAEPTALPLPPQQVLAPWAGISPPRTGWAHIGSVDPDDLRTVAAEGIAEVARGTGPTSGGLAVAELRSRVWSRPMLGGADAPAGMAFAAQTLGFLGAGEGSIWQVGAWSRLSTAAGHVVSRRARLP